MVLARDFANELVIGDRERRRFLVPVTAAYRAFDVRQHPVHLQRVEHGHLVAKPPEPDRWVAAHCTGLQSD